MSKRENRYLASTLALGALWLLPANAHAQVESAPSVVENLSCVDLVLADLPEFVREVFSTPLRRPR